MHDNQDYKAISKHMLMRQLKLYVTQLPAALLATLVLLTLTIQPAHADFRKALSAYQARDGQTMLKEVQDAVNKKNDDGLILFLSVLVQDNVYANGMFYLFPSEDEHSTRIRKANIAKEKMVAPWEAIISGDALSVFKDLLKTASKSLEAQYRLAALLYDGNHLGEDKSIEQKNLQTKMMAANATKISLNRAVDYLLGHKEKSIKRNEAKGLSMLKHALQRPDADLYYSDIADKISTYYFKKKNSKSLKQAYLWSLLALTTNEDSAIPPSLAAIKDSGNFAKVTSPELDAEWNANIANLKARHSNAPNLAFEGLPTQIKQLNNLELPTLIKENKKIDLKQQPVLSLHHFTKFDQERDIWKSTVDKRKNYLIDIFEDGRVYFSIGSDMDRKQNSELLTKTTPSEVGKILETVDGFGFKTHPLMTNGENVSYIQCQSIGGGCFDVLYRSENLVKTQVGIYYITIRNHQNQRTLIFRNREFETLQPLLAKTFTTLENRFHTQQYRCGSVRERSYYKFCIDQDNKAFAAANQGETK